MDVLIDANVIIDLIELECFAHVLDTMVFRFWVVENVTREITHPNQRTVLEKQLRRGALHETHIEGIDELQDYVNLRTVLADGEAACLAVASHRGWAFATYERGRTEREALHLLGRNRYLQTPRLLETAIREGGLTLEELEAVLAMVTSADNSWLVTHLGRLIEETRELLASKGQK